MTVTYNPDATWFSLLVHKWTALQSKSTKMHYFFNAFFISNSPTIIDGKFVINCITPAGN